MASIWTPHFHALPSKHHISVNVGTDFLGFNYGQFNWTQKTSALKFGLKATCSLVDGDGDDDNDNDNSRLDKAVHHTSKLATDLKVRFRRLQETIESLPPVPILIKTNNVSNLAIGLCIAMAFLFISIRLYVARKSRYQSLGSVADLVRRGQLRSDRRGISSPLKYEDPFNNPLVKVAKSNSSVEMCGKVYRLAQVTLTKEQQAIHQKRRSRAYQWKRPTMFLKEGDSIPPDVDADTVRWIPANHPFATTTTDIDEDLAQSNVYQKHGVPFRIQAEHEALQRKLEVLQSEEKLNKLAIDPSNAKDFERPFKKNSKSYDAVEQSPSKSEVEKTNVRKSAHPQNSFGSGLSSEEIQKT